MIVLTLLGSERHGARFGPDSETREHTKTSERFVREPAAACTPAQSRT